MAALPDLSVQLYSVRGPFARDPGGTLIRLAEIGFRRVEPFQLLEHAALEGALADSFEGLALSYEDASGLDPAR